MVKKNSGTIADAQDLFQNAMLELYLNLKTGKFKEQEKPLKNYFLMICLNKWRNHLRQNYKQRTAALQNADLETDDYTEAILFKEGLLDLIEVYLDNNGNRIITTSELYNYIKVRVPEMNSSKGFPAQNPQMSNSIGDLPIFVY